MSPSSGKKISVGYKSKASKYSSENKRISSSKYQGKKGKSIEVPYYNNTEGEYTGDGEVEGEGEEVAEGEYENNNNQKAIQEDEEVIMQTQAKLSNASTKSSRNVLSENYGNPEENGNDDELENEQGREVLVENDEN